MLLKINPEAAKYRCSVRSNLLESIGWCIESTIRHAEYPGGKRPLRRLV